MQNSINKSQHLDYSNCKLSPILFYPDTIQREKNYFFVDNRNRLFLQSSLVSRKIGIIEPNLGSQYYDKLKDMATPHIKDSILNSKKSNNCPKGEENSAVKRSFSSFDHPWNTKNMTFNSNQNFKAITSNNFVKNINNSAFVQHKYDNNINPKSNLPCENRNRRDLTQFNSFQKQLESTPNFMYGGSSARPQVFSSILNVKKVENVISDDVPISNYNNFNFNYNNFEKKFNGNEKYGRAQNNHNHQNNMNNVNVTIINNNNYNLNNIARNVNAKNRKAGRGKKRSVSVEVEFNPDRKEEKEYMEIKPSKKGIRNLTNNEEIKEEKSKKRNWKKIIEICRGIYYILKY
jgi:hypothetical protein